MIFTRASPPLHDSGAGGDHACRFTDGDPDFHRFFTVGLRGIHIWRSRRADTPPRFGTVPRKESPSMNRNRALAACITASAVATAGPATAIAKPVITMSG